MKTPCLTFALAALLALPALAGTWYESYQKAEEALASENWSEAVRELNAALEQRPGSGANVRTYGMRFVDYFPYLKLGIAYDNLGQTDAALQAFETELRQGEIEKSAASRALLQTHRDRIEHSRAEAADERQRRVPALVAESLAAARELEQQGRFEDALAALAKALAVAPDHAEVGAARRRLLAAAAEEQRRLTERERRETLIRSGRADLAAGRHRQAAASFGEALALEHDGEVASLLENAQSLLRTELGQRQDAAERQRFNSNTVARAGELEARGALREALAELQAVLAFEPENAGARALQQRILRAQVAGQESEAHAVTVGALLNEGESSLASGDFESALRAANRVLVLEPTNGPALRQISRSYARLSEELLAPDRVPPSLLFDGEPYGSAEEDTVHALRSPELVLTGTAYDSSPVAIRVLERGVPVGEPAVQSRELHGVWITSFRWQHRLPAGSSRYDVVAVDRAGNSADLPYAVRYAAPFVRTAWFPASIAAASACGVGGWLGFKARRRRRLLRGRFNPYVAGAPILEQARFFGRQQLLDYVLRRVANNSILLFGERRIGKTSFQHRLKRCLATLEDPVYEFFPVFVDLQGTPQEKFFGLLGSELFHELAPKLGGLQPSPPTGPDGYGYTELVRDLQRAIKVLTARTTRKVKIVLLIDEVDELNDYDPRVNQKLRSLFMRTFADSLVSVVSGVSIKKHWEREGSPWYNFFQEIEVQPLDRDEARALIEAPVKGIFTFEDGVADEIIRRTDAKPYLIQRLCSGLVDRMHEERRRRITLADLAASPAIAWPPDSPAAPG